jgi:polar amino acid transport system substrate-binding protein
MRKLIFSRKQCVNYCLLFCAVLAFDISSTAQAKKKHLKVAVFEFPPFIFKDIQGFSIDLISPIFKKHQLLPEYIFYKTVPELLQAVESGECHIGLSGITITDHRERRIDFSHPYFDSGLMIAIRADHENSPIVAWLTILKVITFSIIVFFVGLTVVAHLIWFVERSDNDPKSFPVRYGKGIIDAYWWAVVTMTTVGYGDKCPKKFIGRIVAAVWMIIGIVWFAAFTATMSSSLTVQRMAPGKIRHLGDLHNQTVSVIKGTTSEDYIRYHNVKTFLAKDLVELISNLKQKKVDAVVYDAPVLMYLCKNDPSIQIVGDMFDKQRYGIVLSQKDNDFLKELLDIGILESQRTGGYQRIYNKWF